MKNVQERLREYRLKKEKECAEYNVPASQPKNLESEKVGDFTVGPSDDWLVRRLADSICDVALKTLGIEHVLLANNWWLWIGLGVAKVLLWIVLYLLMLEVEFGTVFFIFTLFYVMWMNTRKENKKKPGELSAYSVFNPGFETIQGTVTAEQLEKEMIYGPLAAR